MNTYAARMVAPILAAALGLSGAAHAQSRSRDIPMDTVIRLELSESLNSRTARRGDRFGARLAASDRSGFPERTRFEGSVIDARRATKNQPGSLGVKIHRAILPDGTLVAVNGTLASLDAGDVRRTGEGRVEARKGSNGKMDLKWIGYGAAGGAVLGTILGDGGDLFKGALLGALGGAAYSYFNKDKGESRAGDVSLARGTEFGVRVHHRVSFRDTGRYRYAADTEDYDRDRYADEDRYDRQPRDRYDRQPRDRDDRYEERERNSRYDERERDARYDERERDARYDEREREEDRGRTPRR